MLRKNTRPIQRTILSCTESGSPIRTGRYLALLSTIDQYFKWSLYQYCHRSKWCLLNLGTHALQGYSSCVCVCVCVPVRFFQTVTNWPGRPMDRLNVAIAWFKTRGFRKTASSRSYKIWVAAVLTHLSAILLALASVRAYIHSRDVTLDHVVFLLQALPLCLAQHYIVHVRIFITGRWPRLCAIVRLKEGI